jgi:hypothetical protein
VRSHHIAVRALASTGGTLNKNQNSSLVKNEPISHFLFDQPFCLPTPILMEIEHWILA